MKWSRVSKERLLRETIHIPSSDSLGERRKFTLPLDAVEWLEDHRLRFAEEFEQTASPEAKAAMSRIEAMTLTLPASLTLNADFAFATCAFSLF